MEGGLNTYAYVGGNPLKFSDPLGLRKIGRPGVPDGDGLGKGAGRTGVFGCILGCVSYVEGDDNAQGSVSVTLGGGLMVCSPKKPEPEDPNSCPAENVKKDCGIYDLNCDNDIQAGISGTRAGFGAGVARNYDGTHCVLVGPFVSWPVLGPSFNLGDIFE